MEDFKEYWRTWLWPDVTRRLITVNCLAWLLISALWLLLSDSAWLGVVGCVAMPASPAMLLSRPWTLVSYMFVQTDFLHLLCNMLWLLLFGRLAQQALSQKVILRLYLAGGLAGGAAFAICNAVSPGPHPLMIGSSCAVAAIIGTDMVMMPKWRVNLMLLGHVKLVWIGVAAILYFAWAEGSIYVDIAHAAGLLAGLAYGLARSRGWLHRRSINARTVVDDADDEQTFDRLLAKVGRSGYGSLTAAERGKLFELSQRISR